MRRKKTERGKPAKRKKLKMGVFFEKNGKFTKAKLTPEPALPLGTSTAPMTVERAADMLRLLTYKPNWSFSIDEWFGAPRLSIIATVPDAVNLGQSTPLTLYNMVPMREFQELDDLGFLNWVRQSIECLEQHELDEWLKFGGKPLTNAHPNMTIALACDGKAARRTFFPPRPGKPPAEWAYP